MTPCAPSAPPGSGIRERASLAPEAVVDFGELPDAVDELLQRGVVAYRSSSTHGESFFREALALAPRALPINFCLYKTYAYRGDLTAALAVAEAGLSEAARQAGLSPDHRGWRFDPLLAEQTAGRFALYTLKALAFIRLKRGERELALELLQHLARFDPDNRVGWSVVSDRRWRVDLMSRPAEPSPPLHDSEPDELSPLATDPRPPEFGRANLAPWVNRVREFHDRPQPLHIVGVRRQNRALFALLSRIESSDERGRWFDAYMNETFCLDEWRLETRGARRSLRNSYLRFLRGWGFDSNGVEGAVIKGWVEPPGAVPPLSPGRGHRPSLAAPESRLSSTAARRASARRRADGRRGRRRGRGRVGMRSARSARVDERRPPAGAGGEGRRAAGARALAVQRPDGTRRRWRPVAEAVPDGAAGERDGDHFEARFGPPWCRGFRVSMPVDGDTELDTAASLVGETTATRA